MKEKNHNIAKISALVIGIALAASSVCLASDYPSGYLGAGFRNYLGGKIQKGYYVETFKLNDFREKSGAEKGNQIAELLGYAAQATPESENKIIYNQFQQKDNTNNLKVEIGQQKQQREKVASVNIAGGFTYTPYSDGKIEYMKDGLVIRIENERVADEFGNVSIKNTNNMQYNGQRLLISYEASLKDHLGNVSKLFWYGATYTADSVYYANGKTNANRSLTEYYLKEIDAAGNVKLSHWKAITYEGKSLRAFSQTIDDSIYGHASFTRSNITYNNNGDPDKMGSYHEEGIGTDNLAYTLDRTKIGYNSKGQLAAYHEEKSTTQIDGGIENATTDAKFTYLDFAHQFGPDVEADPSRLLESVITSTTQEPDGSYRAETTTTSYKYNTLNQIIGATGHSEVNGQDPKYFEYKDVQGHILNKETQNGQTGYYYISGKDKDGKDIKTYVSADQVNASLKDGDKYRGSSDIQLEAPYGTPMVKDAHSLTSFYTPDDASIVRTEDSTFTYTNGLVNNFIRVLGNHEHTETIYPLTDPNNSYKGRRDIDLTYEYDILGNATGNGAHASGTGSGWEYASEKGWYGQYTSTITVNYQLTLGKVLRTKYEEPKTYLK